MRLMQQDVQVVVVKPSIVTDARNNETADFDAPLWTETWTQWRAQPGASPEVLGGRDTSTVAWSLYLPAGTPVDASCRVTLYGDDYAVDGMPQRWDGYTARLSHVLVLLQRWV